MKHVDLYPAIDILSGRVVRLTQGDYSQETVYGDDPVDVARRFADEGARWIHIVDLDAARSGDPVNRTVISRIAAELSDRAKVQTGGGVRTVDDARTLAESGISRVVMGSAAVSNPELVEEAARIVDVAVGLDHRSGQVSVHGWTRDAGMSLVSALDLFPAASAFIITDIARDGMLQGPDVEGLAQAARATSIPVIASGGVSSLADIEALARIPGVMGIITGKAIYEGRFTVSDALTCVNTNRDGS
ncbi:MAG: 1-(5-phosphoribosyl)-5-[(5-phosphoribosylamino)methylideneamino]imidazole-4-carboxamide isomerase [Actinomycetota bacterium]